MQAGTQHMMFSQFSAFIDLANKNQFMFIDFLHRSLSAVGIYYLFCLTRGFICNKTFVIRFSYPYLQVNRLLDGYLLISALKNSIPIFCWASLWWTFFMHAVSCALNFKVVYIYLLMNSNALGAPYDRYLYLYKWVTRADRPIAFFVSPCNSTVLLHVVIKLVLIKLLAYELIAHNVVLRITGGFCGILCDRRAN